jgi:DNA-binding IclR family transcriptional regulator
MQADYLARLDLVPMTSKTIRSIEELRTQLQTIRREGVAYSFEEQVAGIIGTARPVLGPSGNVIGAISIASAAIRYEDRVGSHISEAIAQATRKLSQQLRHLTLTSANAATPPAAEIAEKV